MLKLTRASDYSLRTLVHLSSHQGKTTSKALSRELGVPVNHLAKVVQTLARGGYLKTSLGKGGGIQLARPPEKITLQEIIDLVDGPAGLVECFQDQEYCTFNKNCLLRSKLKEAQEKMAAVFAATTIRDLILLR